MVPETIISGFKVAGVYPLNRRAVRILGEVPTTTSTPTAVLARREGIGYMPFLSSTEEKQLARPLAECKELQIPLPWRKRILITSQKDMTM